MSNMMGRVHGQIHISRRTDVVQRNDYSKYKSDLETDFAGICGYCGKKRCLSSRDYEIDHFVPQKIDENRKNDYSNLVYSCLICNRAKSMKWPTMDKSISHNGTEGFQDPATGEYDSHLARDESGMIIPLTPVGDYMCKVFHFASRPIAELWLLSEMDDKLKELKQIPLDFFSKTETQDYLNLVRNFQKIKDELVGIE